jgi:hypothetical protein
MTGNQQTVISDQRNMRAKLVLMVTCIVAILFATPLWAADAPAKEGETEIKSLTELNKGNLFNK